MCKNKIAFSFTTYQLISENGLKHMNIIKAPEKITYHKWDICKSACKKGLSLKIPIYKFLKSALIRKYGTDWYNLLTKIVKK